MQYTPGTIENTSGQRQASIVPEEIKGWSWAAFLMNWIWAIGNQTWIGLLALLPYVGFIMAIVLGVKGNEWAWQNRRWESVDHFKKVQKIWTYWGVALVLIAIFFMFLAILLPVFVRAREAARGY